MGDRLEMAPGKAKISSAGCSASDVIPCFTADGKIPASKTNAARKKAKKRRSNTLAPSVIFSVQSNLSNVTMVLLHVKRDMKSLFLLEASLVHSVEEVLARAVRLSNGRLKVLKVAEEAEALAQHGTALPPEMRGLLEEQIRELKLTDEEGDRCVPEGGAEDRRDELGRRSGRAPKRGEMVEVLRRAAGEAKKMVSEENVKAGKAMEWGAIKEACDIVRGAVSIVYPMGLPSFDPLRMELEDLEELKDHESYLVKQALEEAEATLWFANKELKREEPLSKYLGKNEKSKVLVKLSTRSVGQPASECFWNDDEAQKRMMADNYRRARQIKELEQDDDDSYMNSPWADGKALKKRFHGLNNISWRPS